ncbi:HEXXH motif domain-containing protein [Actinoplanes sp. NPDC049802]|uniref:HEXXH motif domain-containing protein n=1 Tax=Actinoplanes sp. NPDC049802 TaxID=3154742 RepID=UPI0033D6FCD7
MTIAVHQLSPGALSALARGLGGAEAIHELRNAQLSKHLLLIRFLLDHGGPAELLERARRADPAAFRRVAGDPLTGGWAAIAGRAVLQGEASAGDLGFLSAIAVVAAAHAGIDGSVTVPVHHGLAVLPGIGAIEAGDATTVEIGTTGGRLFRLGADGVVPLPGGPGWLPVRRLVADAHGQTIDLALDDVHPYRHGHHVPPASRLNGDEVRRWQDTFTGAWTLLATHLPDRAAELRAGLETLVPLLQTDPRSARSATIRHAFGVFGLTRPGTPADFAVTLVHEFQHSKLSAILDLVRLTDPDDEGRYFAPWRTDPRPLPGLLQGVYAFAGVADTWRALRGTVTVAEARFAETRLQVDRGLTAIEESGALTADGAGFVAELRATADRLLAEPVPDGVDRDARDTLARIHAAWQDRNGR